jgi:hypothetical protein
MTTGQLEPTVAPADAEQHGRCAVCDHALDGHDHISQRYCRATQSQALTRNCICPSGS